MAKKVRMTRTRTSTKAAPVPRSVRNHNLEILTSMPAGKMVPVAAIPMLREDSARVRVNFAVEQMETVELLLNSVSVKAQAWFVPMLAFERFQSVDDVQRAYAGEPPRPGLPVVPYIETMGVGEPGSDPVLRYLGKHFREGDQVNTSYHEAYNLVWNFRAKNRSPDITPRPRLELATLAPAFWNHSMFEHIVPTFDAAIMEGEVPLTVVQSRMPIQGLGMHQLGAPAAPYEVTDIYDNSTRQMTGFLANDLTGVHPNTGKLILQHDDELGMNVFAEMQENGITISLANIELARKTQAFARLRNQYNQHDDDYIIDMLMDGVSIPDQAWRQPILLQETNSIFGYAKRYATDSGGLTDSVVNGATMLGMNFHVPRCPTGGVVLITMEALPDQLFERSRDPWLHANGVSDLPKNLADMLDPQPVESVPNEYIDIDHDAPDGVFGYAPAGYQWNHAHPCIGGRFLRPTVDAPFDEDRQRIWAVETENPVLSEDFYICRSIHTKPFVDPTQDSFEVSGNGLALITGITQFGPPLIEAEDDYDKVMEKAPIGRLPKPE